MSKLNERKAKRSGSYPCEVCQIPARLVLHHIAGRDIQRCHRKSNIVWICPNCHDKVHSGDIVIEGWKLSTEGYVLIWSGA